MAVFKKYLESICLAQWVLIGAGLVLGILSAFMGVSDNPPGIILLYLALTCLAGAWVWNLAAPRDYWIIVGISLAAFPLGVLLHNLFYGLAEVLSNISVLQGLMEILHVFFFLVAVMAVGPAALVGLIGGILSSWRGMNRLTLKNRSYRRFKEDYSVGEKKLLKLINLARQSASGANLQPLKFVISSTPERNQLIFPTLSWAGYLKEWKGPAEGERPSAYIILLGDKELTKSFQYDAGIASQSITLGAAEMGLGACLIGSIQRENLRNALDIPERFQILLVIALGKPAEKVIVDALKEGMDIQYWRDEKDRHHVPKRELDELILDI
jgi:nitroreductase